MLSYCNLSGLGLYTAWCVYSISSRLDYCNSLFYNIPAYQLQKFQRIQNATARLILQESKFCHIPPLLMTLQWLPVTVNIEFILKYRIYPCALFFCWKRYQNWDAYYTQTTLFLDSHPSSCIPQISWICRQIQYMKLIFSIHSHLLLIIIEKLKIEPIRK